MAKDDTDAVYGEKNDRSEDLDFGPTSLQVNREKSFPRMLGLRALFGWNRTLLTASCPNAQRALRAAPFGNDCCSAD